MLQEDSLNDYSHHIFHVASDCRSYKRSLFYDFLRSSADDPSKPFQWFVQPFLDPTSQARNVLYRKRLGTDKLRTLLTGTDAAVVVSHAGQHHLTAGKRGRKPGVLRGAAATPKMDSLLL